MTLHPSWEQGAGPSWGTQDQVLGLFFQSSILMDMCLISDTPIPVLMTDRPQGADHDLTACPRLGVQPTALCPQAILPAIMSGSLQARLSCSGLGGRRGPWCPSPWPDIATQPPELLPGRQACQLWPGSLPRTQGHCGYPHGLYWGRMGGEGRSASTSVGIGSCGAPWWSGPSAR